MKVALGEWRVGLCLRNIKFGASIRPKAEMPTWELDPPPWARSLLR